ncbi:LysM peptidoglycan-binding domain-containing protein [Candidatus Curtissbacteria bacterium]|nr:LysM peptidoglycan-binding domain-containing protein [Candidatus Curtissbacteria bacterium]
MPKRADRSFAARIKKFNWQDSYTSLILGAIIVIILGLLVANYFTRRNDNIGDDGAKMSQEEIAREEAKKPLGDYKVVAGDSLSKISEKYYGSLDKWPVIAKANNIANPNLISVDAELKIPSKEEAENVFLDMTITSYKVNQGDTLFAISEKVYGNGSMWTRIATANNVGRLPNGNPLIFSGSTLVIPR